MHGGVAVSLSIRTVLCTPGQCGVDLEVFESICDDVTAEALIGTHCQ